MLSYAQLCSAMLSSHRDIWSNFHSGFIFALPRVSQVSKEAKNFKELESIGLMRCFSARIEKTSKNHKTHEKTLIFWHFFNVSSILGEKQCTKRKNSTSVFRSFWHPSHPQERKNSGEITVYTFVFEISWQWRHLEFFTSFSKLSLMCLLYQF